LTEFEKGFRLYLLDNNLAVKEFSVSLSDSGHKFVRMLFEGDIEAAYLLGESFEEDSPPTQTELQKVKERVEGWKNDKNNR